MRLKISPFVRQPGKPDRPVVCPDAGILLYPSRIFKSLRTRGGGEPAQPVGSTGTAIARQPFEPGRDVASSPLRATASILVARHA